MERERCTGMSKKSLSSCSDVALVSAAADVVSVSARGSAVVLAVESGALVLVLHVRVGARLRKVLLRFDWLCSGAIETLI